MQVDLTITISVILALSAIFSPIIVAFINNKHQLRIKTFENYEITKRNAFEKFAKAYGEYVAYSSCKHEVALFNTLYCLFPYFNIDIGVIKTLVSKMRNEISYIEDIDNLIIDLKKQL